MRSKTPDPAVQNYWLIAIGYLFVALNIVIGGLGILLPTCVGYAMIGAACWSLRERRSVFQVGAFPAALLALVTLPHLFAGQFSPTLSPFYELIFWPEMAVEFFLMGVIALGFWYEGRALGWLWLRIGAIATVPVAAGALLGWKLLPVTGNGTFLLSILIYMIPALYTSSVSAAIARRLA